MGNCGHRLRYDRGVEAQEWVEPFLDFVPNWSLELELSERACLRGSLMSMFFGVDVGYVSSAGADSFVREGRVLSRSCCMNFKDRERPVPS